MKNPIVHSDFLLHSEVAKTLYHDYASKMPIIDYHNHLIPKEIATNKVYNNLTEIWLKGDHYKWRALRTNGVSEHYITGAASDREKFQKWAETVPYTMFNPLYHWTHMELNHPFGITDLLNSKSAESIYNTTSEVLRSGELSVHNILDKFNVQKVCTTDDPIDSLEWHTDISNQNLSLVVSTAWRPDKAIDTRNAEIFNSYVSKLEAVSNISISSYIQFKEALKLRHDFFHSNGCRVADHGLDFPFPVEDYTEKEIGEIFAEIRVGKNISQLKQQKFYAAMLYEFSVWNHEKHWVQQFHIGALRDVNVSGVRKVGQSCGFDSIADFSYASSMGEFLNRLEENGQLTKTIVYNLNPKDNEMMASMIGNFQDGSTPGKIQFGSAWWFLDNKEGMEKQLSTLATQGLLSRFVGMLTDSRSFLSFSRHEYFRRILCNFMGNGVVNGEIPKDIKWLGEMVQNISYNNTNSYFDF